MLSSRINRWQRHLGAALHALEGPRPTAVILVMARHAAAHGVGDMAAAVAYYGALASLPLLLFTVTVLSYVLDTETVIREVHTLISQYVPMDMGLIDDNIDAIVRSRGPIGILSLVALAWSGSNVFGAIARFMDRAWGVPNPDAFHLVRARSLLTVGGVGGLILMSLTSAALIHTAEQITEAGWLGPITPLIDFGEQLVLGLTSLFGTIFATLILYRWLPSDRTPWRYSVPAAIIAGIALEIVKNIFLFYLTSIASFEAIYGSLASVIILLLWMYVTALVLLVVAEFGGALREVNIRTQRRYPPEGMPPAGSAGYP